jgi:hypothetical protein
LGQQVWGEKRIAFTERQNVGTEQELANARLIAAAPDLLVACRELVGAMVQLGKEHHREVAAALAAIQKAGAA